MTQSVPPPRWQQRFMEPTVAWAMLAAQDRTRGLVCSDRDGVFQLYAWDRTNDSLTRLTDSVQGVQTGAISADGEHIYYLHCAPNSQTGHIRRVPFAGGQGQDLTPDMPTYSSWYITESESGSHIGFVAAALVWGFRVYVLDAASGEVVFTYESDTFAVGPNLSYDGELAVIATDDRGDGKFALECYDVASGKRIGDLSVDNGSGWQPVGFVPRRNDRRYLTLEDGDLGIPMLWDVDTGQLDLHLTDRIRDDVTLWDVTHDGRYLLLSKLNQASYDLYRYDLEQGGERQHLSMMAGRLYGAYWASDTQAHALIDDPARPPHIAVIESDGTLSGRLLTHDITPEENAAWQWVRFTDDEDWYTLQAWLLTPEGDPPYPTIIHAHGGPADVFTPTFDPRLLAWRDAGYAVCAVNYRGSISFGSSFQNAIKSRIGQLESDDLANAGRHLVAEGIARPDALIVEGASYGGYLALMALSRQPDLWRAGLATAAIADWEILFRDEALAPPLRVTIEGLFSGTPDSRQAAYRAASPLHRPLPQAPLLILQPRQDVTCPPQQMIAYAGRLAETQNTAVQVRWYNAAAPDAIAQQQIEQHQQQRAFLQAILS